VVQDVAGNYFCGCLRGDSMGHIAEGCTRTDAAEGVKTQGETMLQRAPSSPPPWGPPAVVLRPRAMLPGCVSNSCARCISSGGGGCTAKCH
jgi:hypothetical protein